MFGAGLCHLLRGEWREAIAAVMEDVPLPEAARNPENSALRGALEKWGYMERPKAPWLRLAPEYQPKPMTFEEG